MSNFNDLQTTRLGKIAEDILIKEFAAKKGFIPFTPAIDSPHPVDSIMMSGASIWGMDVKCKSSLNYFPEIGIDLPDYHKYNSYPFPVYVLFADIKEKKVYGNWIGRLKEDGGTKPWAGPHQKPGVNNNCMYFAMSAMTFFRELSDYEYEMMKELEQNNYLNK